jgi:hypothetical protein
LGGALVTMRESYDRFFTQYAALVEPDSRTDALMRGAFVAGVQHVLAFVSTDAAQLVAGVTKLSSEIDGLWEKRPCR